MNPELTKAILQLSGAVLGVVVILIVIFKYGYPFLKAVKANGNSEEGNRRSRCVHLPEVRTAIERNLLSSAAIGRVEAKVDDLQEDSTIQTTHLKGIATEAKEQTKLLQQLVNK